MEDLMRDKQRVRIVTISVCLSLCLFILALLISNGNICNAIFFTNPVDNYMDFFNSIIDARFQNPYTEQHVIYPPLCYTLYRVFAKMIMPDEAQAIQQALKNKAGVNMQGGAAGLYIRSGMAGMVSFGVYMGLSVVLFCFFAWKYSKKQGFENKQLIGALMVSAPTLFAIQRGNFVIFTVACLLAFLCYKDDKNIRKRHFGLFMLAVSSNIKIYPAIFGLLLISERKWRDCLWCCIYGILLFVVPMMFFGGLSNVPVLISNIFSTTESFSIRLGTRVDIGSLLSFLSQKGVFPGSFSGIAEKTLLWGTAILMVCYFCMDSEWKRILCLTLICVFVPGFSYMYNLVYLIPLLLIVIPNGSRFVFISTLLCLLFYPVDISGFSIIQVEGAKILPRLWDLVASFAGVGLFGYVSIEAAILMRGKHKIRFSMNNDDIIRFGSNV